MKRIKILLLFLSVSFSIIAQNVDRQFVSALKKNGFVEIKTNDGLYKFQPYGNEIIETTFIPNGEKFIETSHAVVLKPTLEEIQLIKGRNKTEIKMKDISVVVNHSPFQISYFYEGNFLISEKSGYYKAAHEPMDLVNGNIVADETERIEFNLTQNEVLYGGGARALGMNRRGNKLPLYNKAHYGYETHSELMNFTLPVVYSSKMYSIHFDNATVGYLDLDSKKDNTLTYETVSGRKTYQVIAGDDWEELVENYVNLTGKQPLPPRWAFGNFSSRFGYHTQEETLSTINKFLEEGIPVDAIILDLYWFGEEVQGTMGNLDFYKKNFPNPEEMIAELNDKGVKTILITEPFILTTSSKWKESSENNLLGVDKDGKPLTYDFFFGNTGLLDIFKPEAEDWFWNVYKKHNNMGVAGWWGDLGEPEVHPAEMFHEIGTANEVHNIYGHYWAKLVFDGYKKDFPNQRPFILMRAGYAGSQHYGMIPWTGDVNRTWGGLKPQVEISLQMGMQGLAYMHSDLGGFAGANLDNELYARWLQYGVFQPIYRPHAQEEVPSEPVFREEKTKQLAKEAIKLRYSLLPYNYTMAFENSQNGKPLMRPIFFEDTSKKELLNYKETYFWGDSFLISPVVNKGATSRKVYFPANNNWYNFYTNEKVEGGQTIAIKLVEESIPTYVRGGAIIPMVAAVQNTELYNLSNVDVHFYYDESVPSSTAKLYNDDGVTPNAFEKGKFELTHFSSEVSSKNITITIETEVGEHFNFETKNLVLKIHNIKIEPSQINGYNYKWNKISQVLEIEVPLVSKNNKTIQIKL